MKKNRKVKMTFNVPVKVQRQIKNYVEDLGYKSESAFCYEAIEEYLSKLQYDIVHGDTDSRRGTDYCLGEVAPVQIGAV